MKSPVGAGVRTQKVKHGEGLLASAVSETGTDLFSAGFSR